MHYHVCVRIKTALEMLGRGENIFDSSIADAMQTMNEAISNGKTFYTGCSNEDQNGRCQGHGEVSTETLKKILEV